MAELMSQQAVQSDDYMHNVCGTGSNQQLSELEFRIVIVTHHFDVIGNTSQTKHASLRPNVVLKPNQHTVFNRLLSCV